MHVTVTSSSTPYANPVRPQFILPTPLRVIYHPPATIVYWQDGTKTVVKCADNEKFNEEVGLAMAFMRKLEPNRSRFLRHVENAYRQTDNGQKEDQ